MYVIMPMLKSSGSNFRNIHTQLCFPLVFFDSLSISLSEKNPLTATEAAHLTLVARVRPKEAHNPRAKATSSACASSSSQYRRLINPWNIS